MAIWYYNTAATGLNNGTTKTDAFTTFTAALAAATTVGDRIYVSHTSDEQIGATTTYTIPAAHNHSNPLLIVSINFSTDAVTAGASIGNSTTSYGIVLTGTDTAYKMVGVTLRNSGASSSTSLSLSINAGANQIGIHENCKFYTLCTGANTRPLIGALAASRSSLCITKNCEFRFGSTSHSFLVRGKWESFDDTFSGGTTHPTVLFNPQNYAPASIWITAGNLANCSTLLDIGTTTDTGYTIVIRQSKLETGYTLINAGAVSGAQSTITLYDCHSGDVHIHMAYADYYGELSIDTGVYSNDHICDTALSWKITTSAAASLHTPFITPPISLYNTGVSAITPHVECLRSGSTTAYTDGELWSVWTYKGTPGSTRATMVDDRVAVLGTPANQASSSKTAADWTGEHASLNWFGKLGPSASITPAEVGDITVSIALAVASSTVYVDPQIRGA